MTIQTDTAAATPAAASQPSGQQGGGLVLAVERITAARTRASQPSDGGSTGRTDIND